MKYFSLPCIPVWLCFLASCKAPQLLRKSCFKHSISPPGAGFAAHSRPLRHGRPSPHAPTKGFAGRAIWSPATQTRVRLPSCTCSAPDLASPCQGLSRQRSPLPPSLPPKPVRGREDAEHLPQRRRAQAPL